MSMDHNPTSCPRRTKSLRQPVRLALRLILLACLHSALAFGQQNDARLVGTWVIDDGWQIVEVLFRSDGRYQRDERNADPNSGFNFTERGRYELHGQVLSMMPYEFLGEPQTKRYDAQLNGDSLTLTTLDDFALSYNYQFKPGSREDVLRRQKVDRVLIGNWKRSIVFWGDEEFTFRPGGYYFRKDTPESGNLPPDFIRGRYEQAGAALTVKPYSGVEAVYEMDFFGNTLTIIRNQETSGDSSSYEKIPGSEAEVRAKAAAADVFLSEANWQVGQWEIRDGSHRVDLTFRPDGHYSSTNDVEILRGMVRGRYSLAARRILFNPFIGQGLYSRDNGDFGQVDRTREIDYYDGELQMIDPEALSQSVLLARKLPGSSAAILEAVRQAQEERTQPGWHVGVWIVNDPTGWMEFTFRPDNRYIIKAGGTAGAPTQVERGQFILNGEKLTLSPYSGLGPARGFELDLYDGNLFLIGDSHRMVIARKVPGSDADVITKTQNPESMLGERGGILGLWTANLPGESVELVFRPDGQFRLKRCASETMSEDYGLYTVDMATRTLVYDSRFAAVQTQQLDFYDDTLTIYGGLSAPSTYTVNLGSVDASIAASLAADGKEREIDEQWLARIPVGPRDPNAAQGPIGDIPADPRPGRLFETPTVLTHYQLYRRLIPGFVYFNHLGQIRSVAVTHTREWHFFPTGRVLVRFKNYRAGFSWPNTEVDISDNWGAYTIEPKPEETDILHRFAENSLIIDTDLGEQTEMTLEDGRRNLFWGKDYQILSEWASERKPIACQLPGNPNANLINVAVSLATTIPPDGDLGGRPLQFRLTGPVAGKFTLIGTLDASSTLVIEQTTKLDAPVVWQAVETNTVPTGAFSLEVRQGTNAVTFFRLRRP